MAQDDDTTNDDKNPVEDAVQSILEEGQKVRDRIKQVVSNSLGDKEFSVENLGNTARDVMSAAYKTVSDSVSDAVPRDSDGPLRDVVYGLGDAFGAAASSVGAAFETATKQGKEFAQEDIKRVTRELGNLGSTLVSAVSDAGSLAASQATDFAKQASTHANQAAENIKPHIESALGAAAVHPVELTKEAAKAGVDVTRQVAGSLFSALGDFMSKAADAMKTEPPKKDN